MRTSAKTQFHGKICREPLLLPALAMAAGILLCHLRPEWGKVGFAMAIAAGIASIAAYIWLQLPKLGLTCLLAASLGAGIWTETAHHTTRRPKLNAEDGEVLVLSGCVSNPPVFSSGREQFTLDLTPTASARVTVNLKDGQSLPLRYGQVVETTAKMRSPRNFGNPGAFDYASYLAEQHVFWTASVAAVDELHVQPGQCGSSLLRPVYDVRTAALNRLQALYPSDPHTAALLAATLIGETSGVEKRWTSDFRNTGTYHALVISGQHVSVLALTILFIFQLLQFRRIPSLAAAMGACWFYALLTGMTAPVVRAAGAFTLFLIASYCFRRLRVLNVLALVSLVYLALAPHQLFDPSFQLSFLSAAAIALFAIPFLERTTGPMRSAIERLDQPFHALRLEPKAAQWRVEFLLLAETVRLWTRVPKAWSLRIVAFGVTVAAFCADAAIVSGCVQFGLALPMVTYFHRLSVTGLTANIIVIPLLSAVVPTGFLAMATGLAPLAYVTKMLLLAAEWTATWHAQFEPNYRIAAIHLLISLSFAASLVALAWTLRRASRVMPVALIAALSLFAVLCWQPWAPELHLGKLEVTAIDVGQGDSLFIGFPNGKTMLVDAGGFPGFGNMRRKPQMDLGEDVISPYLWSRRIRHIDYAVLSHGHSDHMGGLPAILDNFRPEALWIGAEPPSAEWDAVAQRAEHDGTHIVPLHRGMNPNADLGGARIRVLAPAPDYVPEETAKNNDSLVLEISYGNQSVILTGDAELPVEADLVGSQLLHPVTLLKVGHHGSKTSSSEAFLDALQPKFAFISDGYKNQFHHPHPTVLERLAEHHVVTTRTDQNGLQTFLTDGVRVEVSSFQ